MRIQDIAPNEQIQRARIVVTGTVGDRAYEATPQMVPQSKIMIQALGGKGGDGAMAGTAKAVAMAERDPMRIEFPPREMGRMAAMAGMAEPLHPVPMAETAATSWSVSIQKIYILLSWSNLKATGGRGGAGQSQWISWTRRLRRKRRQLILLDGAKWLSHRDLYRICDSIKTVMRSKRQWNLHFFH